MAKCRIQSPCMCISGTVWLGCLWTTRWRTFPVQMWPTCYWRTSLSGQTMRLRWPPTMGRVWALSAIKSLSGLCREVSTQMINADMLNIFFLNYWMCHFQWVCIYMWWFWASCSFKYDDYSWVIKLECNILQVQCYYTLTKIILVSIKFIFISNLNHQ